MDVAELAGRGVPGYVVDWLQENGITALTPPQEQAVEAGVLEGESAVVSSPTASGKTLIAQLRAAVLGAETDRKTLYLVPLKALGSEKYDDFSAFFDGELDVALSVGDMDAGDGWVETKDLIIMTVEKLDAVLRHNPSWIAQVGLVVVDEIHLLDDQGRGPTLEVALTRLRDLLDAQLLGLSATIRNAEELADWLDCELVASDYRPVDLKEGVYFDGSIQFHHDTVDGGAGGNDSEPGAFVTGSEKLEEERVEPDEELELATGHGDATLNVLADTFDRGHQAITFVRSRKSAEAAAERAGSVASRDLSRDEQKQLAELADRVETVLGSPTEQCRRLADCVRDGAAFHHAGLLSEQRSMVEDAFRDGLLRTVAATPTLAAGMSLPAYRIVVRDVKRYTDNGLQYIPVLEYKQMAGRAGRPEHHDEGEAVVVAKERGQVQEVRDRYVRGQPEQIHSKLAVEPVLRMHALGLIATGYASSFDDLTRFFGMTFYAHQYGEMDEVRETLRGVVEDLDRYGFVEADDDQLAPTAVGRRVAELYVDPDSAHRMMAAMEEAEERDGVPAVAYLVELCRTVEMKPRLRIRKNEAVDVEELLAAAEPELLGDVPAEWDDVQYEPFLEAAKTAFMLKEWIGEVEEDELMERYSVTPGGIRAKVEQADWLLYACSEICTLQEWEDAREDMQRLRTRVKHGITEELLPLVKFDQIGRVRARRLHDRSITSTADIREASFNALKNAVGKRAAESLKEGVGQENVFDKENILDYMGD